VKITPLSESELTIGDRILVTCSIEWLKRDTPASIPKVGLIVEGAPGFVTDLPRFHADRKAFALESGTEFKRLALRDLGLGDRFDMLGTVCEIAERLRRVEVRCIGEPGTVIGDAAAIQDPTIGKPWVVQTPAKIGPAGFVDVIVQQTELGGCGAKTLTEIITPIPGWVSVMNEKSAERGRIKARAMIMGCKFGFHRDQKWRVVADLPRANGPTVAAEVKVPE